MTQSKDTRELGLHEEQSPVELLRDISQGLEALQDVLLVQLNEDVSRLSAQKHHLMNEIEQLQHQNELLKTENQDLQIQQNIAGQKAWAKQLAKHLAHALAAHIQALMNQKLEQLTDTSSMDPPPFSSIPPGSSHTPPAEHALQVLTSLDATLTATLRTLQQDLSRYESTLNQQLNRIHSMESQAEIVLSTMISRLSEQLQQAIAQGENVVISRSSPQSPLPFHHQPHDIQGHRNNQLNFTPPPSNPSPEPLPVPQTAGTKPRSPTQLGLLLLTISVLATAMEYLLIGKLSQTGSIFDFFPQTTGFQPGTGSAILILWLQMLVVIPIMAVLYRRLYPPIWKDIRAMFTTSDRHIFIYPIGSTFLFFLFKVLLYSALGQIPVSVAISIFFIYPFISTVFIRNLTRSHSFLPWNPIRTVMGIITGLGIVWIVSGSFTSPTNTALWGTVAAASAAVCFAGYLTISNLSPRPSHPIPLTLLQSVGTWIFASLLLVIGPPIQPSPFSFHWGAFALGCFALAVVSQVAYVSLNWANHYLNFHYASIMNSVLPILSGVIGSLLFNQFLKWELWWGVIFVTMGICGLNVERFYRERYLPKSSP